MSDLDEATARLNDSYMRVQQLSRERLVMWTNVATDLLETIADAINDERQVPALGELVSKAIEEANAKPMRRFVCALCFRPIEDSPMIMTRADPSPRVVHYPVCPTDAPVVGERGPEAFSE